MPEDGRRRREAGPEGDGVMTWMRTVMAGSRWRSKRAHGKIWRRPYVRAKKIIIAKSFLHVVGICL